MKATSADVDKITKAKYGTAVITAAASTEVAIKFVTLPTAKAGDELLIVSGSTDVGGFVYCAVSRASTDRLRLLNATNATNATKPAAAGTDSMTSASTKEKYYL